MFRTVQCKVRGSDMQQQVNSRPITVQAQVQPQANRAIFGARKVLYSSASIVANQ
jgi:hypothetical protein